MAGCPGMRSVKCRGGRWVKSLHNPAVRDKIRETTPAWLLPGAFGLVTCFVTLVHSPSPARTMPGLVWCILATALCAILTMWSRGRRLSLTGTVRPLLLALLAAVLVSNALLAPFSVNLPRLALYVSLVLLSVAFYLFHRGDRQVHLAAWCLVIAGVHLPFFVEVIFWIARTGPPFFSRNASVPHFWHVRHFGYAGFLAAVCGSSLLVLSARMAAVSFLLTSCALFGIIATGSRGALISWMLFAALLVCVSSHRRQVALHAALALAMTSAAVAALHYSGVLPSPNIFARLEDSSLRTFDSGRLKIWLGAARWIAGHPLFGKGVEAYQLSGCCDRTVSQPHNVVLQLLMQFGLVGSAVIAALGWRAVRSLGGWRQVMTLALATVENRVLAAILTGYVAFAMIDGLFFRELPLIHFALFCGLFAAGLVRASLMSPLRDAPEPQRGY